MNTFITITVEKAGEEITRRYSEGALSQEVDWGAIIFYMLETIRKSHEKKF